jgi:4-hydroxyphenylpyruvate dioxygenase
VADGDRPTRPTYVESIQRNDKGFGEGNFKALFESIELNRMRRAVLDKS